MVSNLLFLIDIEISPYENDHSKLKEVYFDIFKVYSTTLNQIMILVLLYESILLNVVTSPFIPTLYYNWNETG